jgi:thiamine-phosphate pyrophosphorylase
MKKEHKIYALLDYELNRRKKYTFQEFIQKAVSHDAIYLQYRDKINSLEIKKQNLLKIRKYWNKTLIVNDEIELVQYCDGLHLGQEDLLKYSFDINESVKKVRNVIGSKIFGISTHNIYEIKEANKFDIDYIGLGAYRGTKTKDISNILGKEIEDIASKSLHPVAAIGGIRVDDQINNIEFLVIGSNLYEN